MTIDFFWAQIGNKAQIYDSERFTELLGTDIIIFRWEV